MVVADTKSTSITKTINGSHEFTINGYSLTKGMGVGKYICSDVFNVGGHDWVICFFPDGKNPEDGSYVSLFITLGVDGHDVRALFELTLLDQSGKGNHKSLDGGPYTFKRRGQSWGFFYRRSSLEESEYLKDDCFSISCRVGVVTSRTERLKVYSISVPPSNICQNIGQLLESGEGADVTFEVDGERFSGHKTILATRSPVFRAQFFGKLKGQNDQYVKVDDMEAPVFKALLHFIYWDSLPDMVELNGLNTTWVSTLMAQHLLEAADRYALERLKLLCEIKLCEGIAIDTVATTLALADQHHCSQLKVACLKFVAQPGNLRGVIGTKGFEYLRDSCPSVLAEVLEYVSNCPVIASGHVTEALDGRNANGRLPPRKKARQMKWACTSKIKAVLSKYMRVSRIWICA